MQHPANTQAQIAYLMQKLQQLLPEQISEVEDFVDFLKQKKAKLTATPSKLKTLEFPTLHVGSWPDDLSLSRQDMYDNDGR